MTDRFRERRSAYIEESEPEKTPAAPVETVTAAESHPPAAEMAPSAAPTETSTPAATSTPAGAQATPPLEGPGGGREAAHPGPGDFEPLDAGAPADVYGPGGLPAPSFAEIVQVFALQALQFLGEVPLNEAGERHVFPEEAKHFIDLLGILQERTRGNLSPDESRFLEQLLADLRVRYLRIQP